MEAIFISFFFLLGISTGSFLNVVADRVPQGQSIIKPPSHCFNCGHVLVWKDMLPVVSYLILHGRCRYCHSIISSRSFIVEIITGLLFVLAYIRFGLVLQTASVLLFISILIIIIVTRWEGVQMPDVFICTGILIALAITLLNGVIGIVPNLLSAIAGMACGSFMLFLNWFIQKYGTGSNISFQTVLTGGLAGAMVGFPTVLMAISIAVIAGLLFFAMFYALKRLMAFPRSADIWLGIATIIILYYDSFLIRVFGL
jgi:leader peptidase (prepilin peptidase)/N-methyltransferase